MRGLALELWDRDSQELLAKRERSWGPRGGGEPAGWGPGKAIHALTGYEESRLALMDDELVSQIDNSSLKQSESNLLFLDGPEHERVRSIVSRSLPNWRTTAAVASDFAVGLIEQWPSTVEIDIVGDLAVPVAEEAACAILGLGRDEREGLAELLATMTAVFDPGSDVSATGASLRAGQEVLSRVRLSLRRKGYAPGSAIDNLNRYRTSGAISTREMLASSVMLAHASFQNTANLLSFAAVEVLTNEAASASVTAGSPMAGRACVEELLRLCTPASYLIRRAQVPTTVGEMPIAEDDIVIPCVALANRDPGAFDHPDELLIGRGSSSHLAFGAGHHLCLGSAVARAETLSLITGLASKYRSLEVASVTWGANAVMHGPTSVLARLNGR
ncbi:MAG: cytochrome P450 [Acidimicrobiales bacterium]